jgi:hypothetical protein
MLDVPPGHRADKAPFREQRSEPLESSRGRSGMTASEHERKTTRFPVHDCHEAPQVPESTANKQVWDLILKRTTCASPPFLCSRASSSSHRFADFSDHESRLSGQAKKMVLDQNRTAAIHESLFHVPRAGVGGRNVTRGLELSE